MNAINMRNLLDSYWLTSQRQNKIQNERNCDKMRRMLIYNPMKWHSFAFSSFHFSFVFFYDFVTTTEGRPEKR